MIISDIKHMISAAVLANDAVLIEGKHGIGKSECVKDFAKENGYHLEELFLSNQEVGDLIGIPTKVESDGVIITTWSMPIWLQRMHNKASQGIPCILFLDEMNRAPIDVRQSALQLTLEGRIHEHDLPTVGSQRTMVVGAINPTDNYQVDELDPALIDRFLYAKAEVDVTSWLAWARSKNVNQVVRDFIAQFKDRLHWTPADGGIGATPRSWAKLGQYMDNCSKIEDHILLQIMKGKVGDEPATQFFTFYKNYITVVKPEQIEELVEKNKGKVKKIEDLAKKVSKLMEKSEAIQKMEMAEMLAERHMDNDDILPFLVYLYSLEVEICIGFLKVYQKDHHAKYQKLAKTDQELNNKQLFRRMVAAANREE